MSSERTILSPVEEQAFQQWIVRNGIRDLDQPDSRYDYRGYWKDVASKGGNQTAMMADGLHYTDKYKQHGHPTFSVESQYSRGLQDGGQWLGEGDGAQLIQPPVASHPDLARAALLRLMGQR